MSVFVLDRSGRPLMPCTEKRARLLLSRGRARVHRLIPFVIRWAPSLQHRVDDRTRFDIPKTHALDAVCVGAVGAVQNWHRPTLRIQCTGRGSYQRTLLTAQGFPRGYLMRQKQVHGFQTGDKVKAVVPSGKKAGTHCGRVAVRASGSFNIQTPQGAVQGISYRYCQLVQRNDGYGYQPVATLDVTGTPPKPGTLRVPRSTSPA